jgi:hypothetical protein
MIPERVAVGRTGLWNFRGTDMMEKRIKTDPVRKKGKELSLALSPVRMQVRND